MLNLIVAYITTNPNVAMSKMLLLDDDITRQLFNVWKLLEHLSSVELNDISIFFFIFS